ncbi:MAG: Asp-tRNA(Asn)/Glu-tRNA(Gln) amidotransferase subunit GatC [Oscillospiraceae bacterium]
MTIDIKHIAKLAKLKIEENQIEKFENEMKDILKMVENLPEIEGSLKIDENNVMELREDIVLTSLKRDEVLANAPKKQAGCIVVPKTVE